MVRTAATTARAKPQENRFLLDAVPDFYERLKSSYDEKFYRQEVLGEYLSAHSGLVYRDFQRHEHVVDVVADPNRPLLWALDFNVDPMSSIVAQMHGDTLVMTPQGTCGAHDPPEQLAWPGPWCDP